MLNATHSVKDTERKPSILIIEDNEALGQALEVLFESNSFVVSRTTDGVGGLRNIRLMDFDVILCDLVMPNLSGDLFYLAVRRLKPRLCSRFIFMSGHLEDPKWKHFAGLTDSAILSKPFQLRGLMDAVQEVITKNGLNNLVSNIQFRDVNVEEIDVTPPAGQGGISLGRQQALDDRICANGFWLGPELKTPHHQSAYLPWSELPLFR